MKTNIIILGKLLEKRYQVTMKDMTLFIRNNDNQLIGKVEMTKNWIFLVNLKYAS